MCLIIHNPKGKPLDKDKVKAAYENNSDGFGIMWVENEKVQVTRGLFDFNEICQSLDYLKGIEYACHFRYRTQGLISELQCHPHMVLNKEKHGSDLYLMHNGTLTGFAHKKKSDSKMFAQMLRNKAFENPERALEIVSHEGFSSRISKVIGKNNKLLFMGSDGKVNIVNKSEGKNIDDCWYSNTYSLKPRTRKYITMINDDIQSSATPSKFSEYVTGKTYSGNYSEWLGRYYQTERKL